MKGYKPTVLLVDDDYFTMECLLTLVDWDRVGMTPVAHAYDGLTALQLLDEWQPDILVTDISMPILSGLDLAARARQQREGLYIILLTAHEDFQYVKQGLELGADAYLVKQLDYGALSDELARHVGKALEKRETRRRQAALQAAEDAFIGQLLLTWLRENDPVTLERLIRLDAFQPVAQAQAVSVLLFDFSGMPARHPNLSLAAQQADAAAQDALVCLARHAQGFPVFRPSHHAIGLLAPAGVCQAARQCLLPHPAWPDDGTPFVAQGEELPAVQAPRSLMQAEQWIHAALLGLPGSTVPHTASGGPPHPLANGTEAASPVDNRLTALSRFARQMAECIRDAMDAVTMVNATEYLRLVRLIGAQGWHAGLFLLRTCLEILPQDHPFPPVLSDRLRLWEPDAAMQLHTLDTLAERLQEAILSWLQPEGPRPVRQPGLQVKRVMTWVRKHLEEDPSLQKAADAFLLTPNHLGKQFHKETGEYYTDFVLRMKLERSCEYLGNPTLRIYEIAERLGFRNLSHFHAKFHERYGCSPGNWRKQHG